MNKRRIIFWAWVAAWVVPPTLVEVARAFGITPSDEVRVTVFFVSGVGGLAMLLYGLRAIIRFLKR